MGETGADRPPKASQPSSGHRRRNALRIAAVCASLLLALAAIELVVAVGGIDFRQILGRRVPPWEDTRNVLDPELIHIRQPHSHSQGKMMGGDLNLFYNVPPVTERAFDVRYDHMGFRNEVDHYQADCVVIGDSLVEAGGVLADELFTRRMATELGTTVANLGQSHYGPQQELAVLRRFAVPLKPKVCVWVFFEGNDLSDVWRYHHLVTQWPESVAGHSSWKARSFTGNARWWISERLSPKVPPDERSRLGILPTPNGEKRMWFGYQGKPFTPEMTQEVETLKAAFANLSEAQTLCGANGIRLVVAFAPIKFRVYADVCRFEEGSLPNSWVVNPLPGIFCSSLRKHSAGIEVLDLTPGLQEAARAGQMLYYPDDTHWSPEGHQVVGQLLSGFLRGEEGASQEPGATDR